MPEEFFFKNQTSLVLSFFKKWHNHYKEGQEPENLKSRYCRLYDAFDERERRDLTELEIEKYQIVTYHNCIGCNFEEGSKNILDFVEAFAGTGKVRTYLTIYTLLFYTLSERMAVIYHELGVRDGNDRFDWIQFPILRKIKLWANFFKHPKAYMFLHHPIYFLESDPDRPNFMIEGEANTDFITSFYKAEKRNDELKQLFENKKDWVIVFPDLLQFTKGLCAEMDKLFNFILEPQNIEKLRAFTLKDY